MTMLDQYVRDLLVTLSAFSIGSALFTAMLCLRMLRANVRRYSSFAAAKVGYSLVAGAVLVRILLPNDGLPLDTSSVVYGSGLALAAVGFIGVGRTIRREFVAWEQRTVETTPTLADPAAVYDPEEEPV